MSLALQPAGYAQKMAASAESVNFLERMTQAFNKGTDFIEKKTPLLKDITGFAETRHYLRVHSIGDVNDDREVSGKRVEDVYEFRNNIRMAADLVLSEVISGKASLDAELDYGVDRNSDFGSEEERLRLWEGYADLDFGDLSARIGRQVIRWGKADEVNPVDNFTPENFKEYINHERADRKWPVLAVYLSGAIRATVLDS